MFNLCSTFIKSQVLRRETCRTISFHSSPTTVRVTRLSAAAVCRKTPILCQHRPPVAKKSATRRTPDLTSAWRVPPMLRVAPCGAARAPAGLSGTRRCPSRRTRVRTVTWDWAPTPSAGTRSVRDFEWGRCQQSHWLVLLCLHRQSVSCLRAATPRNDCRRVWPQRRPRFFPVDSRGWTCTLMIVPLACSATSNVGSKLLPATSPLNPI